MKRSEKIIGLNLLVLFLITGGIWLVSTEAEPSPGGMNGLIYPFAMLYYVPFHTFIALFLALVLKKDRKAWLISTFVILLTGFSICLGGSTFSLN